MINLKKKNALTATALAVVLGASILASGCTYRKADDALTEAQSMLLEQTHPVIGTVPL